MQGNTLKGSLSAPHLIRSKLGLHGSAPYLGSKHRGSVLVHPTQWKERKDREKTALKMLSQENATMSKGFLLLHTREFSPSQPLPTDWHLPVSCLFLPLATDLKANLAPSPLLYLQHQRQGPKYKTKHRKASGSWSCSQTELVNKDRPYSIVPQSECSPNSPLTTFFVVFLNFIYFNFMFNTIT